MTITPQLIKTLRERTGVGMSKCKKALDETNGDIEAAITFLRKSGMASAVKKEGREAKEGMIAFFETDNDIGIAEINAETDFVVKNEQFQEFVTQVTKEVATTKPASLDTFMQQTCSHDNSMTIDTLRAGIVQTIGENIQVSRICTFDKKQDHSVALYSHMGGKILTLVELSGNGEEALAKDIAMHVAACSPDFLEPKEVPEEVINKEKEIAHEQVQGKPEFVMEKIVSGKLNRFFERHCLSKQPFVKDTSMTIEALIQEQSKKSNKPIQLVRFMRWSVGQG